MLSEPLYRALVITENSSPEPLCDESFTTRTFYEWVRQLPSGVLLQIGGRRVFCSHGVPHDQLTTPEGDTLQSLLVDPTVSQVVMSAESARQIHWCDIVNEKNDGAFRPQVTHEHIRKFAIAVGASVVIGGHQDMVEGYAEYRDSTFQGNAWMLSPAYAIQKNVPLYVPTAVCRNSVTTEDTATACDPLNPERKMCVRTHGTAHNPLVCKTSLAYTCKPSVTYCAFVCNRPLRDPNASRVGREGGGREDDDLSLYVHYQSTQPFSTRDADAPTNKEDPCSWTFREWQRHVRSLPVLFGDSLRRSFGKLDSYQTIDKECLLRLCAKVSTTGLEWEEVEDHSDHELSTSLVPPRIERLLTRQHVEAQAPRTPASFRLTIDERNAVLRSSIGRHTRLIWKHETRTRHFRPCSMENSIVRVSIPDIATGADGNCADDDSANTRCSTAATCAPTVLFVGDIHANIHGLWSVMETLAAANLFLGPDGRGLRLKAGVWLIFLGDYANRGPYGLLVYALLMALKYNNPETVWLIRGNHETDAMWNHYSDSGILAELRHIS